MGRAWIGWIAVAMVAFFPVRALCYVPTVSAGGSPVTWRGDRKLNLAGNPLNQNGLDPASFGAAVIKSLQRWSAASGGQLGFDYWQGTDPSIYTPNSLYNGLSSIYFASNASADPHLSPNVLGLTQVWYDTNTGRILETDIVLNDKNFKFTTRPEDTSGYGSGGPSISQNGKSLVFIENVLTHELGHAFGLSHSGGLQSTMLFMESPEQAHLGCDELTAIHALYPGAAAGARGAIVGTVLSESGQPVFGAHVVAISRRRGTVMATGLTTQAGRYQISALEPGTYFLMIEPYFAGPTALPGYYSGIRDSICSGTDFARTFLTDAGGSVPIAVGVDAGGVAAAPNLVAQCEPDSGPGALSASGLSHSRSSAPQIFAGAGTGFGYVDRIGSSNSAYYKLGVVAGHLEVHALSYSLYSPVHATLSLLDSAGRKVGATQVQANDPVYTGDSGYVNYDSSLIADDLEAGEYTVALQADSVTAIHYPAGALALDASSFVLVTGSVGEGDPPLASVIPVNARCRMDEHFAPYSSPGGYPPRASTDGGSGGGTGFCGTVADTSRREQGSRQGPRRSPPPGAVLGWFLPWLVMLGVVRRARLAARAARCTNGFP